VDPRVLKTPGHFDPWTHGKPHTIANTRRIGCCDGVRIKVGIVFKLARCPLTHQELLSIVQGEKLHDMYVADRVAPRVEGHAREPTAWTVSEELLLGLLGGGRRGRDPVWLTKVGEVVFTILSVGLPSVSEVKNIRREGHH